MPSMIDNIKVKSQYFLPKILISRLIGKLASSQLNSFTTILIKLFVKYYHIDMTEAINSDISSYKTFNDFFTRRLKADVRPLPKDKNLIISPVDGTISEFGPIYHDAILQAKNHYYSLSALLGGDSHDSAIYQNGSFITTYLSPANYHRVHMPLDGTLQKMIFIPGDLFSVNPLTAKNIDNLFARNERVVCFFNNDKIGNFALVMVGATIVASISTVFAGIVAPSSERKIHVFDYQKQNISFKKGDELGHFLMGSTVICLFPEHKIAFDTRLSSQQSIKMGEACGHIN